EEDEEFIYVISGRAQAHIGDEVYDVGPGDFMAFPKKSPAHYIHNPHAEDFVYLVGGTRAPIDICNYPRKGLRQFRVHGVREYTEAANMKRVTYDKR
ncbi:MAG: cupin domain-containing protein, partial [Phycisphaerales bacterium]|nr:cupin domain-containing protein [Phycisphaerales bacterium]